MSSPANASEPRDLSHTLWPDTCLVGVAVIWGVNIPLIKIGLEQLDPFVFNAIRLVISAGVLVTFAWRERKQGVAPQSGIRRHQLVIYAVVVAGLYQLLFLLGVARTTSGNTALIIATVPMWTALLARIFIAERLLRLAWTGLIIALSGTVIVALQKGDVSAGPENVIGNLLILGCAFAWASATVYSRPLLKQISPVQLSATAAVIALPIHLLCAAGRFGSSLPALQSVNVWLIIFYAGVLSSGLALPMWNLGVRYAGSAHAAVFQNLIPLVAIIAAWLIRGEAASTAQMCGGGLILGGLVIMRLGRQPAIAAGAASTADVSIRKPDPGLSPVTDNLVTENA